MSYRIGIDAGSKTIKLVVLNEAGDIVHHRYWRHRSDIRRTLIRICEDYVRRFGNVEGSVAVTGSAGIAVAEMLGLPFVQEVIATTRAVQQRYPCADAIVELGGEDAKVMYLSGTLEQRMNATCAGGTGGFIDTIAFMLGVPTSEMNQLAARAKRIYPIASRCAVFAQSDVRPLLNGGASKEDIAASALDAVVRQTLGGLACGRPLRGTIVFLGGPFEFVPELFRRFAEALNLNDDEAVRPPHAHLFTACGAALIGGEIARQEAVQCTGATEAAPNVLSLTQLAQRAADAVLPEDDMDHLPPLFADEEERRKFEARHREQTMPRARLVDQSGPLYLGFDAGSTTVKYALVNEAGELVASGYRATQGDVLTTARDLLEEMYRTLPASSSLHIAQSVAIGYGDELLKTAFSLDATAVETSAHLRAALAFRPDVSFVLDIGGQDMKALWVENGRIVDAVLNEACSSGCGSFVEGTAHSLGKGPEEFAAMALRSRSPIDLGTKCTVFMTSRVKHAQKVGVDRTDIAAGIAYSVVQNALYRVIGRGKAANMGQCAVVQGGAFKSDAVLRAFELVSSVEAVRPDAAHLMGAIGAALIARDRAHELREAGRTVTSDLIDSAALQAMEVRYGIWHCNGCGNACAISLVDFGDGRVLTSGNRCSRGAALAQQALAEGEVSTEIGNGLVKGVSTEGWNLGASPREVSTEDAQKRLERAAALSEVRYTPPKHLVDEMGEKAYEPGNWADPFTMRKRNIAGDIAQVKDTKSERYQQWLALAEAKAHEAAKQSAPRGRALKQETAAMPADSTTVIPYRPSGLPLEDSRTNVGSAPNVIAAEQELLAGLTDASGAQRADVSMGIVSTLNGYEALPFWHELFRHLGFGVIVSTPARMRAARNEAAESVPSESVCEPAKLSHAQGYGLRNAGADVLFMPRFERGSRCAVCCDYADALFDSVPFLADGAVRFASPTLRSPHPARLLEDPAGKAALFESVKELHPTQPVTQAEFDEALAAAAAAQQVFEAEVRAHGDEALRWLAEDPRRHGIVVAGRPYHMDPALLHDIDGVLHDLGFAVLPALALDLRTAKDARAGAPDALWRPAKHMAKVAEYVCAHPQLDMVALQSFGCGYDAVSLEEVRDILAQADRPFTALKVDEIVDSAHIRIRLRTMAEAIAQNEQGTEAERDPASSPSPRVPSSSDGPPDLLADGIDARDLDTARSSVPPDICFTAAAVMAHALNAAEAGDLPACVRIPRVCQACVLDALPFVLERETGELPAIEWVDEWPHAEEAQRAATLLQAAEKDVPEAADRRPRIGIVGNPLLCFDDYMNENLMALLAELDAEVVLPDAANLFVDDVRYFPQLDAFAEQGVDAVLYLQSFGCLKGHVQARGALRSMAARYPNMPVTIIDYDPESSALNRENRIRLAVEAARQAREAKSS